MKNSLYPNSYGGAMLAAKRFGLVRPVAIANATGCNMKEALAYLKIGQASGCLKPERATCGSRAWFWRWVKP